MTPHRIAGGAIVLQDDAVLLVRYSIPGGGSYLVGPGGGLDSGENAVQAIIREMRSSIPSPSCCMAGTSSGRTIGRSNAFPRGWRAF